ncbi:hypothetical protein JMM81_21770 [Bacillus sp. V3B]|uniref:hypothetical protein n=1 Tax=Bacillus sp. V3B TaxID=2804915 RepID=UPI00210C2CFB|nr:hypothetical protein [Bacillus sp. V3B]MCQ6277493.1 hypothetical protein [Bacillus sp. V3B]
MNEEQRKENLQENEDEVKDLFSQMMFGAQNSAKSEKKSTVSLVQQDQESNFIQIMH